MVGFWSARGLGEGPRPARRLRHRSRSTRATCQGVSAEPEDTVYFTTGDTDRRLPLDFGLFGTDGVAIKPKP